MRLLALTLTLSLASGAASAEGPAGPYKSGTAILVITQSSPTAFSASGLTDGKPIVLDRRDQLLTGSAGLFNPVRIELSSDGATATVQTRDTTRTFERIETAKQWPIAELRELSQRGQNLLREGKWVEARAIFQDLVHLSPTFGGGVIQQYVERCDEELPNVGHLNRAALLIESGQLADAQAELRQVTSTTLQIERREKLTAQLMAKKAAPGKAERVGPLLTPDETQERLRTLNKEALEKIAAGRYLDAHLLLLELQKIDLQWGSGLVAQNLALCVREIPVEQHLNKAELFLAAGDLVNAGKELAVVSPRSLQAQREQRLSEQLMIQRLLRARSD